MRLWMMKLAAALLSALIVLCSACAPKERPVPVAVQLPTYPTPTAPELAQLDPGKPLDSPGNVEALLERDDSMRRYIDALKTSLRYYEQRGKPHD